MSKDLQELKEKVKDKGYKTWLYWKEGDEIKSGVFMFSEAEEACERLNAKLSPASFHEEYSQYPQFKVMADDVAAKMNLLVNLDQIKDKKVLIELGDFLNLKLKRNMTVKNMKFQINEAAELEKEGL